MTTRALSLIALLSVAACSEPPPTLADLGLEYPETRRVEQVDDYHGTPVEDPYRWLEDVNAPETDAWVEAQNDVTFRYLDTIPEIGGIKARLRELWNYEKYQIPFKEGGRYFYRHNSGVQNQSVLYVMDSLDGEPRALLDPNLLSEDGTVALRGTSVSPDGKRLAYGISRSGSDWTEWRVRDVETGEDLPDLLLWSKFSGASWARDSSGFYYSRYDEPKEGDAHEEANYFQKLYFHAVGTEQGADVLVHEDTEHKEWGFGGRVTLDGRYLVISVWRGTEDKNLVYYRELGREGAPIVKLLTDWDADYNFLGNDGSVFYFRTNLAAPRNRVIAIDVTKPGRAAWREVIPEQPETLRSVDMVGGRLLGSYLEHARSVVRVHDAAGERVGEVDLPGIGTAGGFGGKPDDPETFYSFSSFTQPNTIYRYDVSTGASEVFRRPEVDFDAEQFEAKQVFYASKDGTRVPMFIVHRKGIELDGRNPTYLYGYGGFNAALTPRFSVARTVWLEMGGVFAMPNLRGGGEYGREWHLAGTKERKQNVFDDFIAAAEWLIEEGYTSTPKLAIAGGSNGGLLVGACMTQRPDLYGACLPAVGVLDMLRYHRFTIGWAWTSDYGCADVAEEFPALYAYSPLHNVTDGTCYPPTLVTTADTDDRVVPSHSFKFISALQRAQACDNPVLIRITVKAGHGAGKPTSVRIDETADVYGFLVRALGMRIPL